jgi:hypothetical protein
VRDMRLGACVLFNTTVLVLASRFFLHQRLLRRETVPCRLLTSSCPTASRNSASAGQNISSGM